MPTKSADKAQGSPFSQNFQDVVTLIEYEGRPVVVTREFGAFLGYAEGGKGLVDLIMGDWSDEFIPDIDLIVLRNGRPRLSSLRPPWSCPPSLLPPASTSCVTA